MVTTLVCAQTSFFYDFMSSALGRASRSSRVKNRTEPQGQPLRRFPSRGWLPALAGRWNRATCSSGRSGSALFHLQQSRGRSLGGGNISHRLGSPRDTGDRFGPARRASQRLFEVLASLVKRPISISMDPYSS